MDSLIVDLDKVLDDFEAEESTTSKKPVNPSIEYANFLAKHDDNSWEEVSRAPAESLPNWKNYNKEDNLSCIDYGEPYEPISNFDLSEADFAPSVSSKSDKVSAKLKNVVTNGHAETFEYNHDNYEYQHKRSQDSVKSGSLSTENGMVTVNGYHNDNVSVPSSMHNVNSRMIDLHGCVSQIQAPNSSNDYGTTHQNLDIDDAFCKLPIQVVDIFTPVSEESPQIPVSSTYQPSLLPNNSQLSQNDTNINVKSQSDANLYDDRKSEISKGVNEKMQIVTKSSNAEDLKKELNATVDRIHNDFGAKAEKRTNEIHPFLNQQNNDDKKADEGYDSYDCLGKDMGQDRSPMKKDNHSIPPNLNFSDFSDTNSLSSNLIHEKSKDEIVDSVEQTLIKTVDNGIDKNSEPVTEVKSNIEQRTETEQGFKVTGFDNEVTVDDDDMNEYLKDISRPELSEKISDFNISLSNSSSNCPSDNNSFPPEYSKISEHSNSDENVYCDYMNQDLKKQEQNTASDVTIDVNTELHHKNVASDVIIDANTGQCHQNIEERTTSDSLIKENNIVNNPSEAEPAKIKSEDVTMSVHNVQISLDETGGARPKDTNPLHDLNRSSVKNGDIAVEQTNASETKLETDNKEEEVEIDTSWHSAIDTTDSSYTEENVTDEVPVMRRNNQSNIQSEISRPHSWGPSGSDTVPIPQQKRPNSLNIPQLGGFNVSGERSQVPYTFPYPSEDTETISPETVQEIEPQNEDVQDVEEAEEEVNDEDNEASGGTEVTEEPIEEPPQQRTETSLGQCAPKWIPDHEAPICMGCEAKFTFTKRRHHCRACGKVFCSQCCNLKSRLTYMEHKEARVCVECHRQLTIAELSSQASGSPNPNNPSEYCSVIPPSQQASARSQPPSVLVPASALKREGSNRQSSESKHVMFSDGIRPGGDLTELDGSDTANRLPLRRSGRSQKKVEKSSPETSHRQVTRKLRASEARRHMCLIPETGLPPVIITTGVKGDYVMEENKEEDKLMQQIKDDEEEPVIFALNANLFVLVKIISLDCCVNRTCWCFTTKGMCNVGQDEIVFVLEVLPEEKTIPMDILQHFYSVYEEAGKGNTVTHMGHTIFNQSFLDSRDHGGILYIRPTFQCLHKLLLPTPPYVFGVLLQKWETPWAKVFPLRLLLRLGAEYRYYPCPLISVRNRKPVFFEIGHTIMNLLADFRNFQYMLPQIKGVSIHMEDKKTAITFPKNRYDEVMKVVNNSNEHVMAMGASFSLQADSHLVCIQNDDGNYQTQAINIQNKPRKVTGASFVVFNGALKTSSGLKAKSSIVEDGLMVQITPESMVALKQALKDMTDYTIECGSLVASSPDEVVSIKWGDDDKNINIGVRSPIDSRSMDGVESIHIPNATDYVGERRIIRWTDVFFIQNKDSDSARWEPVDLSRLAETLSNATCIALTPHLDKLKEASLTKIGLRVNIEMEKVGYEIGADGEKLPDFYMNDLDNELIPVIHSAASQNRGGAIILELIFHILD